MPAFLAACAIASLLPAMPPQSSVVIRSIDAAPANVATPQETHAVVRGNHQFAVDLYHELGKRDGNLFFSPYSINKSLSMTYAGARGETAREMAAALHITLPQDRYHRAFLEARSAINRSLQANSPWLPKGGIEFLLSATLWGQRGHGFQRDFLSVLQECYGAPLQEVDFAASDQARAAINRWAAAQTRNRIPELLPSGAVNSQTRLVLASAIYFKGDWTTPFSKNDTHDEVFHVNSRTKRPVPMMRNLDTFGYFEDQETQVLRLPYRGNSLAMLVLLPTRIDGLASLEKSLTGAKLWTWASKASDQKVHVVLPRFKMNDAFELQPALAQLGMKSAFVPGSADLSGMDDGRGALYIDRVIHKAFVEVNEKGTEAAAATAVCPMVGAAPGAHEPPPIPVFRADHPFAFAIYDMHSGLVLFLGRVVAP